MRWQFCGNVEFAAGFPITFGTRLGLGNDQAARVQVHLAADRAGEERVRPAIFAVSHNRVADCRHMHAQLVGAPGQRFEFNPRGALACAVNHAVTRLGGRAVFLVDMHLLAAGARLLGERGVDHAFGQLRHADHQSPIDLARRAAGEALGETRSSARGAGDQQHARGVLVEPVHKPRARGRFVGDEGIEQAIDVLGGLAPALRGEARGLVEHDRAGRLADHHVLRFGDLFGAKGADAGGGPLRGGGILAAPRALGRHAQDLALLQPIFGLHPLAIDPDLPGARPARYHGKADLRQIALEPAVEPDAVVILADGELADIIGRGVGHCILCAATRPMMTAAIPAISEAAA